MTLLLDVGNTRIKAALDGADGLEPAGRADHRGRPVRSVLDELAVPPGRVGRIVACCVAGATFRDELATELRRRYRLEAEFVRATREACGVISAYPEPARLGADRWAAVIAAHARGLEAACVVDVGSALTVDGLASGPHLGGLIIPGIGMMQQALFEKTGDLRALSESPLPGGRGPFANDTREAIVRGSVMAAAGVVRFARREYAQRYGRAPVVVLTGGDARRLLPLLDDEVVHAPHLILEGLACLAASAERVG
jgi:type III pantothenate kinase